MEEGGEKKIKEVSLDNIVVESTRQDKRVTFSKNGLPSAKSSRSRSKSPIGNKIQVRKSLRLRATSIRLVITSAYRNTRTGDVYLYGDPRKMVTISLDASMKDLLDACRDTLDKDVVQILVQEKDEVVPFVTSHTLHSMEQIYAVVAPPPRSQFPCLRTAFFENINFSHPGHKLLSKNSGALKQRPSSLQKSAYTMAILCRSLSMSVPVVEEGNVEIRSQGKKHRSSPGARDNWSKIRGAVLGNTRPFFVYPWKSSLQIDFKVLIWMICLPLLTGLPLCLLPFESETDNSVSDHGYYVYVGMPMLGLVTGLFLNAWLGFYFYIHMSLLSYVCVALCIPGLSYLVFWGLTTVAFPFYNTPVCIMLILTVSVILISYPHIPYQLRSKKKTMQKDISNSLIVIYFLVLVFIVNRLLVTNFGQRDAPSLITLSILYPVLVTRSTEDCARLTEAFNRKAVSVVEAFFTYVSSIFQMIVFLGIHAKVNPVIVFLLLNSTDMFCLFISGPLAAFLKKKNRRLLKHHKKAFKNEGEDDFGFESFIKWVKDPLKLKPLLIKCYCEVSAKFTFIILSLIIRFGPSSNKHSFPFIHDIEMHLFLEAILFTMAEMMIWLLLQYSIELYLRKKRCQYMLYKEKKNMQNIKSILGITNTFITVFLLLQQTPASGA